MAVIQKIQGLLIMFLRLYRLVPLCDLFFYIKDFFGLSVEGNHLYQLRNGTFLMTRNKSSDRSEMVNILSGHEYGELLLYKRKFNAGKLNVIDAGANIGLFSVFLSQYLYPPTTLLMIEPDQDNLQLLKKNLMLNDITNAKIYRKALYNLTTKVNFDSNCSFDSRKIDHTYGNSKVSTITLKELITKNKLKSIDVLKLDIEGGEWFLFTKQNLPYFNRIKLIILEYHLDQINQSTKIMKGYFKQFKIKLLRNDNLSGLMILLNKKYAKN